MLQQIRHWRERDLRFLGLIALTGLVISLYLAQGLRVAEQEGSGWRKLELDALLQRVETGDLREWEADWSHPSTEEESRGLRGAQ